MPQVQKRMVGQEKGTARMSQSTPGPWHQNGDTVVTKGSEVVCIRGSYAPEADGHSKDSWTYEAEPWAANARLIAAAPEMLDLLTAVLSAWHSNDRNFERKEPTYLESIRALLAKVDAHDAKLR